jgi:hypothetical protein
MLRDIRCFASVRNETVLEAAVIAADTISGLFLSRQPSKEAAFRGALLWVKAFPKCLTWRELFQIRKACPKVLFVTTLEQWEYPPVFDIVLASKASSEASCSTGQQQSGTPDN